MNRTAVPDAGGARLSAGRLIACHALAATGAALPWPALLAAVWQVTDDPGLIGLAGAARFAPCVLLSAFLGGIGDRFGRLRTVRVVVAVRLGLLGALGLFMVLGLPWAALVAGTLTVAAGVPAFPSLAALVPQVSARPDRDTNALVTWEVSAFVVGPAIGGLLLSTAAAWSTAACVPLLLAALLVLPRGALEARPSGQRPRLLRGLRAVLAVPVVRRAVATVMVLNAVIGVLGVGLLSLTATRWDAGIAEFGWLTAVQGFASLAAPALIVAVGRLAPIVAAHLVVVLPLVAVAVSPTWLAGAAPLALLGAGLTLVECTTTRMLQRWAPAAYTALALGVADAALVAAAMLGAVAAPWLLGAAGPVGLLLAVAGVSALVLAWGLRRPPARRAEAEPQCSCGSASASAWVA